MFEKFFSKGAYLALIIATFPLGLIFGQIGPQMKDFLCGCEYCETVDTGEPLDIGGHMIRCHSWRKGMQKTMELMRQSQGNVNETMHQNQGIPDQPKIEVETRTEQPAIEENFSEEPKTIHNDYTWREHDIHGWNYSTTAQHILNDEGWIYREDLKWVWTFSKKENFLYSMDYGWFYAMTYRNYKLLYWYDRRIWMLSQDFPQNH